MQNQPLNNTLSVYQLLSAALTGFKQEQPEQETIDSAWLFSAWRG